MNHQALARKWRPKQFKDVVGQQFAVQALSNALTQNFLHHAYLFTGTRGVGKTTIARIFAKCLNCETGVTATPCESCRACSNINNGCFPDLFEIDAASRTKVEDTRDILDNVQYAPTAGRFKIYLIDEVHMLSGHSFNALLKTLEEPPEHVKFLLATTDPQKLPATILSRCLQFHLSHLTVDEINRQLTHILNAETIQFDSEAVQLISAAANGSLRDALSLLDQAIAYGNGAVLTDGTRGMLGTVDKTLIIELLNGLALQDANKLITTTAELGKQGIDFSSALKELLSALHNITLLQFAPDQINDKQLAELASKIGKEDVQLYYQIGLIGQRDLNYAPSLQSGFEMTLLRMLAFTPNKRNSKFEIRNSGNQSHDKVPQHDKSQAIAKPPASSQTTRNWNELFNQLSLSGAARMLAEQCCILKKDDSTIALSLNIKHKALLQDAMVRRINDALNTHFNRPIKLTITLSESAQETPRVNEERKAKAEQQNAEQAIYNDDNVQKIIKAFDAKIIKETIKPVK